MRLAAIALLCAALSGQVIKRGPLAAAGGGGGHTYTVQAQTAALVTGSGVSTTCTFSPAAAAGDLVVAFGTTTATNSGAGALAVSDDQSNTYSTAVNDTTNLSGYGNFKVFYGYGVASGTSVITLSSDQFTGLDGVCFLIHDSAGSYAADPLDTSGGAPQVGILFTGSNSYQFPSVTPTQSDGVVLTVGGDANGVATGWTGTGSPWSAGGSLAGSLPVFAQYLVNASTTAYAPTITTTGSGTFKYHGATISFKHP